MHILYLHVVQWLFVRSLVFLSLEMLSFLSFLYKTCECVQVALLSIVLTPAPAPAPRDGNDEKNDISKESKCVARMQHCINMKDLVQHPSDICCYNQHQGKHLDFINV